jgi:Na+-translocating ferredoxin:NAD+ oxidoreductase RnfD subunit
VARSRVVRFLETPKGLLTIVLAALVAIAAPHEGWRLVLPELAAAVCAAGAVDAVILRYRHRRWEFPSGAVLTALIAGMVLSAQVAWYVATIVSVVAVLSKYVARTKAANVFNPAALAIVLLFPGLHAGQSWWGALPDVRPAWQLALAAGGIFIADRVNKLPLVVAFLGAYFSLFTIAAFARDPAWVAEIYRAPDLQAVLYFSFFILTDPPTSPVRYPDQLIFAAIVAIVSFAIFEWTGAVFYLLAGVLAGNAWESWRRATLHRRRVAAARATSRLTSGATPRSRARTP